MFCGKKQAIFPRVIAMLAAIVMVFGSISFPAKAANDTSVIAAWEYSEAPESGLPAGAVTGSGTLNIAGATYTGYSSKSLSAKEWTNGGYWEISSINAADYESLTFSASMRSSNTGPKNFQLEYSLNNGSDWTVIEESTVENTVTLSKNYDSFSLPDVLSGTTFSLRVNMVGNTSVNDGTVAATGTSNINNIEIKGTAKSGSTVPTEKCAAVTASPEPGELASGTEVSLLCPTDGADIYYKLNDSAEIKYESAIQITEDTTITAYASKEGYENSETSTFSYTLKEEDQPSEPDNGIGNRITELNNGDTFVIYNPTAKKVMSAQASGSRLSALDAEPSGDDILSAPNGSAVLTAAYDETTGYYTLTSGGKYLTSGATGNSLTLEDSASDYSLWALEQADENGGFFLRSANASYNGSNNQYIEYYNTFTTYGKNASSAPDAYLLYFYRAKEGVQVDSSVVLDVAQWAGNTNYENAGVSDSKVIPGDLYQTNDLQDQESSFTAVVNGTKVQPYTKTTGTSTSYYMGGTGLGSGSDDYIQLALSSRGYGEMDLSFRLRTSNTGAGSYQLQYSTDGKNFSNFTTGSYSYKYTAYGSDGTSSDVSKSGDITDGIAHVSDAPTYYITYNFDIPADAENADQLYIRLVPGTERAKGEGTPSTSGTLRMDSVVITGSPVISSDICGYVKADPASGEASVGSEVALTSSDSDAMIFYSMNGGDYQTYSENSKPVLTSLPATLRVYAAKDGKADSIKTIYQYTNGQVKAVKASPNGGAVQAGTQVTLSCETEGAAIWYSEDNGENWTEYTEKLTLSELPKTYQVKATKEGYLDSAVSTLSFTERTSEKYNLYFGQLHSHTSYSDGAGSCEEAYQHASGVNNLDFLAVTDHSNSFDNADAASISDGSMSQEWVEGHQLADQYTTNDFVSIFGYEMTWSNGLGHVNTFNTDGFQSRTQSAYTTYSTALQNYYETLKTAPDSITQFNHPGTTFGDFSDFSYYDEEIDKLITTIEVGNGEGAIGSSGYFPSYEYYQRALDKGWHVAPTNNQDNHKGLWGDANTARSVVMADSLTRDNIYDAMRNYRVYATEDNDLSIYYTLDGYEMGSILSDGQTGDTVTLKAELSDPTDASIGKVQVITNGGLVLDEKTVSSNEEAVEFTVNNDYSYYYLKITETDGDIAVTAPVWVGEVEAAGINSISTDEVVPVQGEALAVDLELYNNEASSMDINSIEFSVDGETVHTVDLEKEGLSSIASMSTAAYSFDYTYNGVGSMTITATVNATLNGVNKIYTEKLPLTYVTPEMVTRVIIDGTHYNDYVTGYYGANVGNFTKIAGEKNVKVQVVTDEITPEMLENCALLVISAPAKKTGTANAGAYEPSHFSDDFIQMVKNYTDQGGTLIACGIADYQDSPSGQTTTEMNKLLNAIGATTTLNSDEAYDEENNGGQPYRLYLTNYNADSRYLSGAQEGQEYSAYSGCTVNLDADAVSSGKAEALVTGFDTTYSIDSKDENGNYGDSSVVVEKGNVVALAHETLDSGANIFVSGTVFISDFEVKAELDNNWDLPYLNRTIAENILDEVTVELETTPIADVRKAEMGEVFAIEGYVTSGTSNEYNTFFDTIYVQDETGGITVFPYSTSGLEIGTKVRIIGYRDAYQGDAEIQIMSSKILDEEPYIYQPEKLSAKEAMDYEKNGGKLVQVTGKVVDARYDAEGTGVSQFWIDDGSGVNANIFIDGYIFSGTSGENKLASDVKIGETVSAVGLVYAHPEGDSDESVTCLRVRNCDEIMAVSNGNNGNTGDNDDNNGGNSGDNDPDINNPDNDNSGDNDTDISNPDNDNSGNNDADISTPDNGNSGNNDANNSGQSGTNTGIGNSTNTGNSGNSATGKVSSVKTGDQSPIAVFVILAVIAGGAICAVIIIRRKRMYENR